MHTSRNGSGHGRTIPHQLTSHPHLEELLLGAVELERTDRGLLPHRLPHAVRRRGADSQLLMAESQPSGVRLAFTTTATVIEIDAIATKRIFAGLPRPDGVYDLLIDGRLHQQTTVTGGDTLRIDMSSGARSEERGPAGTTAFIDLPAGTKTVEIWLPHDETTVLTAVRSDAPLHPNPSDRPRWVHYGSSISQGSNAASPSTTWPALTAAALQLDLVNLGFGGSAMLDIVIAQTIATLDVDLITLEIGINIVNADAMRQRIFIPLVHGFLDVVRSGHPDTPLYLISPIFCPIHEDTPGPAAPDLEALARGQARFIATGDPSDVTRGKLTLKAIRAGLSQVTSDRADDPHLHLITGLELYGEADARTRPLANNLHPDPDTHQLIGARAAQRLSGPARPLLRGVSSSEPLRAGA